MKNYKGKDPVDIGVIYQLNCQKCPQIYIRKTKLYIKERMKQHYDGLKDPSKSNAADHMLYDKNHAINFKEPEILLSDISKKRREIKETIFTLKYKNTFNKVS